MIAYEYRPNGRLTEALIYYWQGHNSSLDETAVSAVVAAQWNQTHYHGTASTIRIKQGKEPLHFLSLFGGHMTVHRGGVPSGLRRVGAGGGSVQGDIADGRASFSFTKGSHAHSFGNGCLSWELGRRSPTNYELHPDPSNYVKWDVLEQVAPAAKPKKTTQSIKDLFDTARTSACCDRFYDANKQPKPLTPGLGT